MPEALWPILVFAVELSLRLLLIGVVLLRRRPASVTLAWIVVILALPLVGAILYLLVGEVRLGRKRLQRHQQIVTRIQSSLPFVAAASTAVKPKLPRDYQHIAALAESIGHNDALGGNALKLIGETNVFIQSLVDDIDEARHHCHLLFYIFLDDHSGRKVAEALMRAAARGVTCRLLVDAVGSRPFLRSDLSRQLRRAGVHVVGALSVSPLRMLLHRIDLRNHRKLAVIDSALGYTGSHNIADAEFAIKPRFAPWVDAMVRLCGPSVWDLQMLFVEDWYLDTGESLEPLLNIQPLAHEDQMIAQVIGTGPGWHKQALRELNHAAFHAARQELILTTPYFVPDDATLSALCSAGRRGVDTTLVLPARNDSPLVAAASRGHYAELLECGVQIYEYQRGLLHAKTTTIDRSLAMVSTANIDRRSFELNFEVSLLVYDNDFASQLRFLQRSYMTDSVQILPAAWRRKTWPVRLWHAAAGTLSPLL